MAGNNFPFRNSSVDAPATDGWKKTRYASDHVCRPIIVDTEGRKRPIVSYGQAGQQNSDFYGTTTETIVQEHVLSPFGSEHKHVSHKSHGPLESYQVVEERWHSPSSPVHSRPQKVDEFLNKVHAEAIKPRFGPSFSPANRSQTAKPTHLSGHSGGYSSDNDFNDHDRRNHSGKTYKNDDYNDNFSTHGSNGGWGEHNKTAWGGASPNSTYSKPTSDVNTEYFTESVKQSHASAPRFTHAEPTYAGGGEFIPTEPNMITHGGWARPSAAKWASPPNSNLSKPISDINTAMEVLKEAAQPRHSPAMNSRYTESGFTETIDSTEAARRYKFNYPQTKENNYTTAIDSREAAMMYQGKII
ncbi:uncharacterized protein LOC126670988 [Mercurialis annua]|uniref:uncharacterized protein LOC126670988 n=1 Tax=Mercurialis annua TaxID=3986 RepID=UPI0021601423|nr:uncharacterized protein LOC126670988 [Mercurialis annua]